MFPTVTLKGTSRTALIEQFANAWHVGELYLTAMREAAPHGRDYPGDTLRAAVIAHRARVRAVEDAQRELRALWEHAHGA